MDKTLLSGSWADRRGLECAQAPGGQTMTPVDEGAWYGVQTHIDAESKAASNLVRQGFRIYHMRDTQNRLNRAPSPGSDVLLGGKVRVSLDADLIAAA